MFITWYKLDVKQLEVEVLFVWIPSHYGIIGHDLFDLATSKQDISLPILAPKNLKSHLRLLIFHLWSEEWTHTHTIGKLRTSKPNVSDWTGIVSKMYASQALETAVNHLL